MCQSIFFGKSGTEISFNDTADASRQIELRAATLYAMRWRIRNDVDPPRSAWDEVLAESKWLREDFKCEAESKRTFLRAAAQACKDGASTWNEKLRLRQDEPALGRSLEGGSTIPEWAREEYMTQVARSGGDVPVR